MHTVYTQTDVHRHRHKPVNFHCGGNLFFHSKEQIQFFAEQQHHRETHVCNTLNKVIGYIFMLHLRERLCSCWDLHWPQELWEPSQIIKFTVTSALTSSFALTFEMQMVHPVIKQLSNPQPRKVNWFPNLVTLMCFRRALLNDLPMH